MKLIFFPLFIFCLIFSCSASSPTKEEQMKEDPITGFFPTEHRPEKTIDCFPGAYYRKVVSSHDLWVGISATVKLPQITFDTTRLRPDKPGQYMDNPSIYLGGNGDMQETDMGLTWEVIRDENGEVTPDRRAYRPFCRRNPYGPTGQQGVWESAPALPEYYFYPGDIVTMTFQLIADKILRLTIESKEKKFEKDIQCDGYRSGYPIQMKRVVAIDQVHNEGKPVQPTTARLTNTVWYNTHLLRDVKGEVIRVPMHTGRFTDMRCPEAKYITVTTTAKEAKIGAETISIDGKIH